MSVNTYRIGHAWEDAAAEYLRKSGFQIIERNFRFRKTEIDIIGIDGTGCLVFIEVKYRHRGSAQNPLEAVDHAKQKNICVTAMQYIITRGLSYNRPFRFDVLGIDGGKFIHIKNAFEFSL